MSGRLEAIYLKSARRGPMRPLDRAEMIAGAGIVGNANQGGRRQVTLLERERWEHVMTRMRGALPSSARRANLLVSGLELPRTSGRILRVGECRIRILGETKPCSRMDEAMEGLQQALAFNWGGGAYGEVLSGGAFAVGDVVAWEDEPDDGSLELPL